jgi:hypothetical protein
MGKKKEKKKKKKKQMEMRPLRLNTLIQIYVAQYK